MFDNLFLLLETTSIIKKLSPSQIIKANKKMKNFEGIIKDFGIQYKINNKQLETIN